MRHLALSLVCLFFFAAGVQAQPAAATRPAPPATLSPAQAQQVLDVLQDPKKRAEFTSVLENMIKAAPAPKPAITPLLPQSLGAQVLVRSTRAVDNLAGQFTATVEAVNSAPELVFWFQDLAHDRDRRDRVIDALWKLGLVLLCARVVEWVLMRALRRPRRALGNRIPYDAAAAEPPPPPPVGDAPMRARLRRLSLAWRMMRRLPFVLTALVLDLIPVVAFYVAGNALLSTPLGATIHARLVVIAVVNAYVVCRVVLCVTRAFVSPGEQRLRLVACDDDTAAYVQRWMRRLTVVAVFGYALAEVGSLFGLYHDAHDLLLKVVSLALHIMLVIVVLQKRRPVANRLRARRGSAGVLASLQNHFAGSWHLMAIFYIVALWLVAAADIQDGYTRLLHFFLVTTAVALVSRLLAIVLLGGLDRMVELNPDMQRRFPQLQPRLHRYQPVLRAVLLFVVGLCTGIALLEVWGFSALDWFVGGRLGQQVLSAVTTSGVTIVVAIVVWEAANAGVDQHLAGLTRQAQIARATRLRTLLPILRTTLLVSILIIAGLIVLSEIGVNVAPLLAGAGVLGVAIGFGSQKLVQDLITGLFLLLENTMRVGDVVTLGGLTGTVETLSIRTIRLRALDGSMHVIPFSSVTTVTNETRDFSYALVDLSVGLDEEPDHVAWVVREIVAGMRKEARWQDAITADVEIMGLHAFSDNAWTLRLRIRTQPSERWAVNREFNRRVKYKFDELVIQSPITGYKVQGWTPPGSERPAAAAPVEENP